MDLDGGSAGAQAAAVGGGAVEGQARWLLLRDLDGNPLQPMQVVRLAAHLDATKVKLPWLPALGLVRTGSSFRWLGAGLGPARSVAVA